MKFVQQILDQSEGARGTEKQCPDCGMTFSEFKAKGRFGCPSDYEVFQKRLIPLLERMHDASIHIETEKDAARSVDPKQRRLAGLRTELRQAIDKEKYEEAASLRDQISRLEEGEEAAE